MRLKIEVDKIKEVMKPLNLFINEVDLWVSNDRVSIVEYDYSDIILTELEIKKEEFIVYEVKENKKIRLNLDILNDIIKDNKGVVEFSLNEKETKLYLSFDNGLCSEIPLIERERDKKKKPNLEQYNYEVMVNSNKIKNSLIHFKRNYENISFRVVSNKFYLVGVNDLSNSKQEFKKAKITEIRNREVVNSKFDIDYIEKIFRYPTSKEVEISIGNDFPIEVIFKKGYITLSYVVAPRIE
ncbi:MAG: hypothetical protein ACOC56_04420 [Atribacterota bacterium]